MTARFIRLNIAGFKSFADPTSVEILPGLTGIVGPNGCGKSNVVEALRWVMGESSARSLRGGELDDLIFAGTTSRPARSFAEVTVTLEGVENSGLAILAGQSEVQITRRADRGAGSEYRINGKVARARDVQILFADLASGARSSAMVSQGRVARLVSAKPEERRVLLEEAAGITGLHARRHEAELKLRATENNLLRAEDLCQQLSGRLENLSDQCQEAARYREISAGLRKAESDLTTVTYARAHATAKATSEAVVKARNALTQQEALTETAVITEYEITQRLPAIRTEADTARTTLERYRVMAETISREKERAASQARSSAERLQQHENDSQAARTRAADASTTLRQLLSEQQDTELSLASLPDRVAEAENSHETLSRTLTETELRLTECTETLYRARLHRDRAQENAAQTNSLHTRNCDSLTELNTTIQTLQKELPSAESLTSFQNKIAEYAAEKDNTREHLEKTEAAYSQAQLALSIAQNNAENARKKRQETEATLARARASLNTLSENHAQLEKNHTSTLGNLLPQTTLEALQAVVNAATHDHQQAQQAAESSQQARQQAADSLNDISRSAETDKIQYKTAQDTRRAAENSLNHLTQQEAALRNKLEQTQQTLIADTVLQTIRQKRSTLETDLATLSDTLRTTEDSLVTLRTAQRNASAQRDTIQAELARLEAQAEGLTLSAEQNDSADKQPVSALMSIPKEYELALAAALAKGLDAPLAQGEAPQGWRSVMTKHHQAPPLPEGTTALATYIKAPAIIEKFLSFTGLLSDKNAGDTLQTKLLPGQCLVSLQGDLWRWDGFYARADQQNQAAKHLIRRRMFKEVQQRIAELQNQLKTTSEALSHSQDALNEQEQQSVEYQTLRTTTEQALQQARSQEAETERAYIAAQTQTELLNTQLQDATLAREAAETHLTEKKNTEAALRSPDAAQDALKAAQRHNDVARQADQNARHALQESEQKLRTASTALSQAENQQAAALTRLETLEPELKRLKIALTEENDRIKKLQEHAASSHDTDFFENALKTEQQNSVTSEKDHQEARQAATRAQKDHERAIAEYQQLEQRSVTLHSKLETLLAHQKNLLEENEKSKKQNEDAQHALQKATDAISPSAEQEVTSLQQLKTRLVSDIEQIRETRTALQVEQTTLTSRQTALITSIEDWSTRAQTTQAELEQCLERLRAAQSEHQNAAELPAETEQQEQKILTDLDKADSVFKEIQTHYEKTEAALNEAIALRRQTETALADHREALLKAEAKNEQAQEALTTLPTPSSPSPPLLQTELTEASENALRRKIARLTREREDLGPVNLRAELETEELTTQLETLTTEIADLKSAIASLRGSVGALNKTGRERLMATFTQIDHHFQLLFSRMFEGGKAHLGFVGSDDPLESGLEIYAQPPGKKLSTLSLLSGGEQALTALSLIFAVFRCNPAPLCVLDEVDAPLDDANVERFSRLMGDMVTEAKTRFLVVTHHQLTMAHMDHLFGVTMQERGVSRVLSVDLTQTNQPQSA